MPSFWDRVKDVFGGGSPWNDAHNQPENWWARPTKNYDQYQWDPTSMRPVGMQGTPRGELGQIIQFQYEADRLAEARREAYRQGSLGSYNQATALFQKYRPGGAASLASGLYQGKAGLYRSLIDTIEAPDMLLGYREKIRADADIAARKAANKAMIGGFLTAGATALGGILGGPVGAAAGAAAGGQIGAGMGAGAAPTSGMGTMGTVNAPGSGGYQPSSYAMLGAGGEPSGGTDGGGVGMARLAPEGGGVDFGAGGGGGGAAPGGGGGGGGAMPPAGAPAGDAGPMGAPGRMGEPMAATSPWGSGYGADGNFSPTALAASGARASTMMEPLVTMEAADSIDYRSTAVLGAGVDYRLQRATLGV